MDSLMEVALGGAAKTMVVGRAPGQEGPKGLAIAVMHTSFLPWYSSVSTIPWLPHCASQVGIGNAEL